MTKHTHFPYKGNYKTLCFTIQTENTTSITSHPLHHNSTLQSDLKNTIFNNDRYTINIPTDPHTLTTTDITSNMCHKQTSRHLATSGNNKILHAPPPHISSSKEIPNHINHHYAFAVKPIRVIIPTAYT